MYVLQWEMCLYFVLCILILQTTATNAQNNDPGHFQTTATEFKQSFVNPPKLKGQYQQQQQQQYQQQQQKQKQQQQAQMQQQLLQLQQQQLQQEGKQKIVESKSVVDFQNDKVKFPENVFGTYRGRWLKVQNGNLLTSARLVMKHFGVVVYQIRPKEHQRKFLKDKNVVEIEGDIVLRQGQYITDYDLKLPFEGIYIPKTGKLHAIIQPTEKQQPSNQTQTPTDKMQQEEARKKAIREGQTHIRQKISFAARILQQCQFRVEMMAGELEDTLVVVQMPVVITDDEVDWGQLQKKNVKEKSGKGVYMEGRFYSPNCQLDLLVNGRTFYLQQQTSKS